MKNTMTRRLPLAVVKLFAIGVLAGLTACNPTGENGAEQSPDDETERGGLSLTITSAENDVEGFWIQVFSDDWSEMITEQWAPLEEETLPAGLVPGIGDDHRFGDSFFWLPAGTYNVRAMPMVDQTNHSRVCEDAETEGVVVEEELTTEIVMISECDQSHPGGLDVIVTTDNAPLITDLDFLPSKFIDTCEPMVMKVQVEDPDGDPVEITWKVVTEPAGAQYETDTHPDGHTWVVKTATPGDYEAMVTVCGVFNPDHCSSATFPFHVSGEAYPSVDRCPPTAGVIALFSMSDVLVAEDGDEDSPGAPYDLVFSEGDEVPADFLAAWRWFKTELESISEEDPGAEAMTPEAFGAAYETTFRQLLDSLPAVDAETSMERVSNGITTMAMEDPPEPVIDDTIDPCDKPSRGYVPTPHCSGSEQDITLETLENAHYQVWRMRQLLDRILAEDDATAEQMWAFGEDPDAWDYEENNFQPHNWFGRFNRGRAEDIRGALEDIWDKYLGPGAHDDFRVQCYPRPSAAQRAGWVLSGQWWKFSNPCYWTEFHGGGTPAHHWNKKGPELCNRFFEEDYAGFDEWGMRFRGSVLVHEFLHRTWIGSHMIKDTHYDKGCTWEDGAPKCYSEEDSMGLAQNHPGDSLRNNSNYEYFGLELAEQYQTGACTDPAICSERDQNVAACNPPEPTFPGCPDPENPANFGQPGCPCANINIIGGDDTAEDGGFADGAGSHDLNGVNGTGQYCEGPDVVCAMASNLGLQFPRCETCGEGSNLGCPCQNQNDCQGAEQNLYCWGLTDDGWFPSDGGQCLPSPNSPAGRELLEDMPWFCLDNCDAIDAYQDGVVGCVFNQTSLNFSHGECIDFLSSCPGVTGECEETGFSCNFDDVCEQECESHEDCADQGFPDWYLCDGLGDVVFAPAHCVPPECVNDGSFYCNLYR